MRKFQTLQYSGVWLEFSGDRMAFRTEIEKHLQGHFDDPNGKLEVKDDGPYWAGREKINLSYSHSESWGLLVYSKDRELGVDVESKSRRFSLPPLAIAERYFHAHEVEELQRLNPSRIQTEFLKMWVKKEALAKLTRKGLSKTVHDEINAQSIIIFESVPLRPVEMNATVAFF